MISGIKKLWAVTDKLMLLCVTAASLFGIIVIMSSTAVFETHKFVIVQSAAFLLGIIGMFLLMIPDYNSFGAVAKYLYGVSVALLVLVLIIGVGSDEAGAQSWIRFGGIGIQPSEIVKILFIITFACHLSTVEDYVSSPIPLLGLVLHLGLLITLVLLQNDYGTAMVYIFIAICMLFSAKISYKYIIGAVVAAVPICVLAWLFVLQDYQKNRVLDFLSPNRDVTGSGYQVIQSKVAIGSGGIIGKGIFKGSLVQSGALPASHTDFIFASVGEEFGLIGCLIAAGLIFVIIYKCIHTARTARTALGTYMCIGVAAMLTFHTFENIGMCMGVMPVTGIPLPFFSYGGSSMVSNLAAIGLVMNVWSRRNTVSA